jgi:hypothetical protein
VQDLQEPFAPGNEVAAVDIENETGCSDGVLVAIGPGCPHVDVLPAGASGS